MAFLDHLAAWSADDLSHLMAARPDLLPASDRGREAVARKAGSAISLGRALVGADVGMLVVAEALVAKSPADLTDIDRLLGTGDPVGVADAVERLRRIGVVVVEDGVVFPVGALADLLHRPLGLGPSFAELADHLPSDTIDRLASTLRADGSDRRSATIRAIGHRLGDPQTLAALLADAPPRSRDLLDQLVAARSPAVPLPTGYPYRTLDPDDPLAWLVDTGLVAPVSESGAELPRELVIAAMPDGLAPTAALRPIDLQPVDGLADDLVIGGSADRANLVLDAAETLLRLAADGLVSVRKAGGIGPRELARLAKRCGLDPVDIARLFELLSVARLITVSGNQLTASDLAARWWSLARPRRYLALARAWLAADRFLSRGLLEHQGSKLVALGDAEPIAAVGAARTITLRTICQLPEGSAFAVDQLAATVVWQGPNLWGTGEPPAEDLVDWTIEEAELLGLVADGAPSPILRSLTSDDEVGLARQVAETLADDQDRFVLQSDLTAVAFGPLAPAVSRPLGEMTEPIGDVGEARALGYRFTEQSVRTAFDRGWTAPSITAFLEEHALAGVPQPLAYLLADVARRYGAIRVQPAQSVVITADEVAAVELGANRKAAALGLRLIAPTVMTSPLDPVTVTEALRDLGLFPVLEGSSVVLDKPGAAGVDTDSTGNGQTGTGAQAGRRDGSPQPVDLPADWIGPPLSTGPVPEEIIEAVRAITELDPPADPAPETDRNTLDRRLRGYRGRAAVVDAVVDGRSVTVCGTVVATGRTIGVLTVDGVVEIPVGSVLAVGDPAVG
ncbi:MAG: helicase-associated domain-containing protein [Actinomycetota bacterium]